MHSTQIMDIFNIFSQEPHVPMDIFVATFDYLPASSETVTQACTFKQKSHVRNSFGGSAVLWCGTPGLHQSAAERPSSSVQARKLSPQQPPILLCTPVPAQGDCNRLASALPQGSFP
jgi:hypothetical protein